MELIDTHCHLYLEDFDDKLPVVMDRAAAEGVREIYLPALDSTYMPRMLELERKYPSTCFAMAGIHPCYVKDNYREELDALEKLLDQRRFAAVGEIGLDYYWDRKFDNYQMISFEAQIELAKKHGLPIVIHSRSSMDECIEVLRTHQGPALSGIFHCFSGSAQNAFDIIDCGFVLGIGGVVTYKNSGLAAVVAELPLDKIVLETDAPYLTPVPFRGKPNESSYLKYIVQKVADIKGVAIEEVARTTTSTARSLFSAARFQNQ